MGEQAMTFEQRKRAVNKCANYYTYGTFEEKEDFTEGMSAADVQSYFKEYKEDSRSLMPEFRKIFGY
jgi:hypothetical protein